MNPAESLRHFFQAFLIGLPLGAYYGFLRPLRPRHTLLSDFLFLPAAFYAWLVVGFGICLGDLRLGCCSGLLLGAVVWDATCGRLLRPVFAWFWRMLAGFCRLSPARWCGSEKNCGFFQFSSC